MTAGELMCAALEEAALALAAGEVAVGAVIERGGRIIARAHNRCEQGKNAALHAEMLALEIVDTWLDTSFEGGRHARRVAKVMALEDE